MYYKFYSTLTIYICQIIPNETLICIDISNTLEKKQYTDLKLQYTNITIDHYNVEYLPA